MSKWYEAVTNEVLTGYKTEENKIVGLHTNVELHLKMFVVAFEQGATVFELFTSLGYEYVLYSEDVPLTDKLKKWVTSEYVQKQKLSELQRIPQYRGYLQVIRNLADRIGVSSAFVFWELGGNVRYFPTILSEKSVVEWILTDYTTDKIRDVKQLPETLRRQIKAMRYDTIASQQIYLMNLGVYSANNAKMSFTEALDLLIGKYPNFILYNFPETEPDLFEVVSSYGERSNITYGKLLATWGFEVRAFKKELTLVNVYRELAELFPDRIITARNYIPKFLLDYLIEVQANIGISVEEILKTASFKLEGGI